jgi:hypothetical protein
MDAASERFLIQNENITKAQALESLNLLANKELLNLKTGIKAQINVKQRNKIISNKAVNKSLQNGFTREQHNAVAANINVFWKNADQIKVRKDKADDVNILSIKGFESPVYFPDSAGIVYFTVKESLNKGHRIYSLEIKNPQRKGNTPEGHATAGDIFSLSPSSPEKSSEKNAPADPVRPHPVSGGGAEPYGRGGGV